MHTLESKKLLGSRDYNMYSTTKFSSLIILSFEKIIELIHDNERNKKCSAE